MNNFVSHRTLPNAEFQRLMEAMLEKESPDKVLGWGAHPIPAWAVGFRPRTILDIGTGLGAVTTSVLFRLAQWGCLSDLRRVVLTERDEKLHPNGSEGLKAFLEARISDVLDAADIRGVKVDAQIVDLALSGGSSGIPSLKPVSRFCPPADLVLASHVSYYFGDGSGCQLVDAIGHNLLSPHGRLWVAIRSRDCPVYRSRYDALRTLNVEDPQPLDYAEEFEVGLARQMSHLRLLDKQDVAMDVRSGTDRLHAAILMMWRRDVQKGEAFGRQMIGAAEKACLSVQPLLTERQFILTSDVVTEKN
jgi:hypothetical protein